MHRQMRRIKQQLSQEAAVQVMREATSGVLALEGDDGYPYAVPISHVWSDECLGGEGEFIGRIYFHSAREGYKIDSIMDSEKASFAVVVRDEIVPDEYTTYFKSAIATGRVHVLEDDEERLRGLRADAGNADQQLKAALFIARGKAEEIKRILTDAAIGVQPVLLSRLQLRMCIARGGALKADTAAVHDCQILLNGGNGAVQIVKKHKSAPRSYPDG